MNILHWAFPFHPGRGGQSIWIERMAIAAAQRGHKVGIMIGPATDQSEISRHFKEHVTIIPTDLTVTDLAQQNAAHSIQIAKEMKKFKPDVIHVHNLESKELVFLRFFQVTRGKGLPVICTLHDLASVRRLQKLIAATGKLESLSVVVSPSKFIDAQFESLTSHQREKFHMIYHGIPLLESETLERTAHPKLLFASDLQDHKGGVILLSAWKKIHAQYPNYSLTIAGDGPAKTFLEQYAYSSGLGEQINFVGWLSQEQLQSFLRDDCILIIPSLLGEAFGLIGVEAAMAEASIIVSRIGALPEIVENEVSGLVVKPGDSHELSIAIERLLTNQELRSEMGRAARHRAEELFSFPQSFSAYELLYEEVINSKGV